MIANFHIKSQKLLEAITLFYFGHEFYFFILNQCHFSEYRNPSFIAGVRVTKHLTFEFAYNPDYIETCTTKQINFILLHELQHLLSNHLYRFEAMALEHEQGNIAGDMIINRNIMNLYGKDSNVEQPIMKDASGVEYKVGIFPPEEYKGDLILEPLYYWLQENKPQSKLKKVYISIQNPNGDGSQEEVEAYVDGEGNIYIDKEELKKKFGMEDEVSREFKEHLLDSLVKTAQARGVIKGNDEATLGIIRPSKKNYLKEIKMGITTFMGNYKKSSWKKFSRKYDLAPGFIRERPEIVTILDVSGSMGGLFEKALSFVFQHNISINLIQADTEVQKVVKLDSLSDFKSMTITGLGGTTLQPAIDFVKYSRKYKGMPLLVLTDGYCDELNFDGLREDVLAISIGIKVVNTGTKKIKNILVEKP